MSIYSNSLGVFGVCGLVHTQPRIKVNMKATGKPLKTSQDPQGRPGFWVEELVELTRCIVKRIIDNMKFSLVAGMRFESPLQVD